MAQLSAIASLGAAAVLAGVLPAQGGTLDLLDGETLYEGGWLLTIAFEHERRDTLRSGSRRVRDASDPLEEEWRAAFAAHYGLRHDLQVGFQVPWLDVARSFGSGPDPDVGSDGLGDVEVFGKWRFLRRDARHRALNVAVIAALDLPTGDDDARGPGGVRLPPELQVGQGSFDPSVGFGATYEPRRWRFNLAAMQRFALDTDGDDHTPGDRFVGELAVGNRFWLEPYPGPFMRLDATLRYYHEERDRTPAGRLADTGGERLAAGLNLAFRPRPSLDFQVFVEVPVWQDVHGTQLGVDWTAGCAFGYRF